MKGLIFPELPYNINRVYTSAIDKSGCKIYIPVINIEKAEVQKKGLIKFLGNQPPPPLPPIELA